MPKVTIVLPTYNGSKYLRNSIESVIDQTYKDWELVIVDDCSTDETFQIANDFKQKDERIIVIHNCINKKLPASLNIGFQNAHGEYFTWTSDDNIYEKDAIKKMVKYLDANRNIPMVRADMLLIDENAEVISESQEYNYPKMFINNCVGACFMYRRSVAQQVGQYDETLFCVEDYDYWIRIMEQYGTIGNIKEFLYQYRWHAGSLSSTRRDYVESQLKEMRKRHLEFFINHMQSDEKNTLLLYFMLLNCGWKRERIFNRLNQCQLIKGDVLLHMNKPCVVYGAGYYGQKALELLKDKVIFFVDQNESLIGTKKNGIDIKNLKSYLDVKEKYQIVIALSEEKIYDVLVQLNALGICEYITFTYLESQLREGV